MNSKWVKVKLREIVSEFIVPMRDKPKKFGGNIPWCRIEDFNGIYLSVSKSGKNVDEQTIKEMKLRVYPTNTVLVSCSADLGRCAITKAPLVTNQTFIGLVPSPRVDSLFLYFLMTHSANRLNDLSTGTTISYLSRSQFENFIVTIPTDIVEQKEIAQRLLSVVSGIDKTEQIIQMSEKLKVGLTNELFTKGIGHTKYKKSKLGQIPEDWDVKNLGEICHIVMGQSPKGSSYNSTGVGVPLLNGPTEFGRIHPTPVQWTTEATRIAKRGDILFCVRGSTTGKQNISDREYCIGRGLAAIKCVDGQTIPEFVKQILLVLAKDIYTEASGSGSTFPNITSDRLRKFEVSLPPIPEQEKITGILKSVDEYISSNTNERNGYLTLKREMLNLSFEAKRL